MLSVNYRTDNDDGRDTAYSNKSVIGDIREDGSDEEKLRGAPRTTGVGIGQGTWPVGRATSLGGCIEYETNGMSIIPIKQFRAELQCNIHDYYCHFRMEYVLHCVVYDEIIEKCDSTYFRK